MRVASIFFWVDLLFLLPSSDRRLLTSRLFKRLCVGRQSIRGDPYIEMPVQKKWRTKGAGGFYKRKNSQCLKTTQCLQAKTYLCETLIGVKLHDDFCCLKIYIYLFLLLRSSPRIIYTRTFCRWWCLKRPKLHQELPFTWAYFSCKKKKKNWR